MKDLGQGQVEANGALREHLPGAQIECWIEADVAAFFVVRSNMRRFRILNCNIFLTSLVLL